MGIVLFQQRIRDLEKHVAQAQELISDYEEDRDFAENPRTRARCEKAIKELKTSVRRYFEELEELQQQLPNQDNELTDSVSDQLAHIEYDLRVLMGGQVVILRNLEEAKRSLVSRYDDSLICIVGQIIDQLNQNQLRLTHNILNRLEIDKVTTAEAEEALALVEQRLASLTALPSIPLELTQVVKNPNLDARHRLKVCIPIIPLLLDYEGEIELGTGLDFKALWNRIKARLGN